MAAVLWLKLKRMRADVTLYIVMALMAVILSFVFGQAFFGGGIQRVYVTDADSSAASAEFIKTLDTDAYTLVEAAQADSQLAVAKREALAGIVIPAGFSQGITGEGAHITLLKTSDNPDIMALESALQSAYSQVAHICVLHSALSDMMGEAGMEAPSLDATREDYQQLRRETVSVDYQVLGADSFDEAFANNVHFLMGFNIFFVLFSIVFTVSGILEDKHLHTWNRIRISPLSAAAVLAGHFIPAFAVGALQMGVVLFLGQLLFGLDLGSTVFAIYLIFVLFALTATCLGLLLSMVLNTYEQLGAVTPVIVVATSMLGGCMWPLSIVGSDFMLAIANAMPQKWALEAVENMAIYGGGLGGQILNIGVLLGMALVFFAASAVIYNKKQRA